MVFTTAFWWCTYVLCIWSFLCHFKPETLCGCELYITIMRFPKRQKFFFCLRVRLPLFWTKDPAHWGSDCLNLCFLIRCSRSRIKTGIFCKYAQNECKRKAKVQESAFTTELLHLQGHAHILSLPSSKSNIKMIEGEDAFTHNVLIHTGDGRRSRWQ